MFSRAIKLLTLNGFDIKVDQSWLIIAALITWSLSAHVFPDMSPGQAPITYLLMAVVAMLGFFASLLLHELAHSVVARRYGVGIEAITLFLFGGVAEMKDEPASATAEMQIAIAGPAMSVALAFSFAVLSGLSEIIGLGEPLSVILGYLATINLVLALFNLVPAFPLDGGRVLRAVLWKRSGNVLKATETAARSGIVFSYLLIGFGMVSLFGGSIVGGLWQIMLGIFLQLASRASYDQMLNRVVFSGKTVADAMTADPTTVPPDMPLSDVVDTVILPHRVSFLPVVEDGVLLGRIDSAVLTSIDRENWNGLCVDDVFVDLRDETVVTPDTPIEDLFALIGKTGQRKFLVTRDTRLVGVITLADLTRYVGLAREFDPRLGSR